MYKLSNKKQIMLIYAASLMYMFIYPAKLNYNALIVEIIGELGGSKGAAGLVGSFFFFAYGVGQVLSGILAKYMNEKYVTSLSLLLSGVCNLGMSFAPNIGVMKYIWLANGIVLSTLWCNIIKILSKYINSSNLPKALTYTGFSMPIGTAVNYVICAVVVQLASWRASFLISAGLMLATSAFWFWVIDNVERSAIKTDNEIKAEENVSSKKKLPVEIGVLTVVGIIFIAGMTCQFVREGIIAWVPTILKEEYNMSSSMSIFLTLFIPLMGAFSNILLVKAEEKTMDFLVLSAVFAGASALFIIVLILCYPLKSFLITFVCFILVSTLITNVNGIAINHIPLYYREKMDSGLLAGIGQGFAYLGSTVSVFGLGYVADKSGWFGVFYMSAIITVATTAMCIITKLYTAEKKVKI